MNGPYTVERLYGNTPGVGKYGIQHTTREDGSSFLVLLASDRLSEADEVLGDIARFLNTLARTDA